MGIGAATDETPSRLASGRELLQKFRDLLLDDERQIAESALPRWRNGLLRGSGSRALSIQRMP
jgi:hypothetical protein